MAYLLPPARDDDIRKALDPNLSPEQVPTDLIRSAPYLGMAESWAKTVDVLWASRVGVEQENLYMGIIFMTASLLSRVLPQSRQVNLAGHTATFTFAETPEQRTARLAAMALESITLYLAVSDPTINAPLFVTTVSGRRG